MEQEIGSLEPGKRTDFLLLKPDSPIPVTSSSVIPHFAMTFRGCDVDTVLVDGEIVVAEGKLTRVDEAMVEKARVEQAAALWKRNGIDADAGIVNL